MPSHEQMTVEMKLTPRRLRVEFGDEIIVDSSNALVMFETHHAPVYYFPMSDVRMDLLEPTNHGST